jgi:hypothetical protein
VGAKPPGAAGDFASTRQTETFAASSRSSELGRDAGEGAVQTGAESGERDHHHDRPHARDNPVFQRGHGAPVGLEGELSVEVNKKSPQQAAGYWW